MDHQPSKPEAPNVMEQYFPIYMPVIQLVLILVAIGMAYQAIRSEQTNQAARLVKIEGRVDKMEEVLIALARQDERLTAMDSRMMAQGQRIDSTAQILSQRLEAINNILSGHTAQLNNLPRVQAVG